ncbi:MAG: CAP domain-containing protein, partial [Verrucomicrobiota bacterium JB024]|nr:CAP domain-containing protein [Verrucomicrobiota bacterium JB024]
MLRLATLSLVGVVLPSVFTAAAPTTEMAPPPAWRMNYPDPRLSADSQPDTDIFRFISFAYTPASTEEATPTLIENGENGTDGLIIVSESSEHGVVQDQIVIEGTYSFHLYHASSTDSSLTLTTPITVSSGMKLYFESWLRYATTAETASVQVSTDGGNTWPATLYSLSGNNGETETTSSLHEIDLSAYAGQTIRLRFYYDASGSYFPVNEPGYEAFVGWFFDNIQVGTSFSKRPYSIGDPTDDEQYYLEMINRARADANAEAQRLANTTDTDVLNAIAYFEVDLTEMIAQFATLETTVQPLSFNEKLLASARLHSQDMYDNTFQGHTSSPTPPTPNLSGDTPGDRATHQGYDYSYIGENVYANARSVFHGHAGFQIDWGSGTYGMQDPPGHRENIHAPDFKEAGIGVINGNNSGPDWTNSDQLRDVGPQLVTQDFAIPQADTAFITGV